MNDSVTILIRDSFWRRVCALFPIAWKSDETVTRKRIAWPWQQGQVLADRAAERVDTQSLDCCKAAA
jgi:hypothetical protein